MATAALGTTERTNQLLAEASKTTGIAAPTFPTTLNSSSLTPSSPIQLPPPPAPTNYNPAIANGNATFAANTASIAPSATAAPDANNFDSLFKQYMGSQPAPPSASDIYSTLYKSSGVDQATQAVNDKAAAVKAATSNLNSIQAQLAGLNAEATAAQLQQENRLAPTFAIAGEQGAIDRSRAIKALPLQAQALAAQAQVASAQGDQQLAQGILQQATDHLDTAFKLQVEDAQAQYQYKQKVLDTVYQYATAQEQRRLDKIKTDAANQHDVEMANLQFSHQQQLENLQFSHQRSLAASAPVSGYNGDFAATIDLASNTGGTNQQRGLIKSTLQSLIAQGDYKSAYAAIQQATAAGLKGEAAKDFQNRSSQLEVTKNLTTALQQLQASGYNTNQLTGGFSSVENKVGALVTNPQYAAAATELRAALQSYRLQMTGANFSPQEARDYANVLPSAGNTFALNQAKIQGLQSFLRSSVDSYTHQVVGQGGQYIREYAEGATPPGATPPTDPLGLISISKLANPLGL